MSKEKQKTVASSERSVRGSRDGSIMVTGPGIRLFQLLARKGALELEMKGMRRRGRSAYSICKEVYGLKGSRQKVLDQLNEMVEKINPDNIDEVIPEGTK